MEVFDSKLNPNNPVQISQLFSRLVENVTSSKNGGKQEFIYLKSKCLGENHLIGDVARISILKLIENGVFQIDQVFADFITSISTARNSTSLTKIITSLLYLLLNNQTSLQNKNKLKRYQLQQHPLVKILQGECLYEVQMCIFNEISQSVYKDLSLSSSVHTLFEPLYLYCICNPSPKPEFSLLRQKLWSHLIKYDEEFKSNMILKMCFWLQMQDKNSELAGSLLDEVFHSQLNSAEHLRNLDYLILMQILNIHNMILNNTDCRRIIKITLLILPKTTFCHYNVSVLILAKAVSVCSPLYLEDLLNLCFYLTNADVCQPYSFLALKSTLLHWLASPCILTQSALRIAKDILNLNDYVCRKRPSVMISRLSIHEFHYLTFCNPEISLGLHLGIKIEFCKNENEIIALLESFEEAPVFYLKSCFSFLCGMLLNSKFSEDCKVKVLSIILKCSSFHLEFLPNVFTLILYLLSNTQNSKLPFELLKALPPMVMINENLPKVITILQAISKHSCALNSFALRLLYDTWKIENKCYSILESVALQSPSALTKDDILERNITRAYIFMKLSEKRPELYGKDLVGHLSRILNECTTSDGVVPSALALEGIRHLCKAEVIDIVTTWATLSPKFKNDTRIRVVKSLCELVSEIPLLEYAQSYEKLNDEVIQQLWLYVVTSENEEIINSALQALATFSFELICQHFPETFLDDNNAKSFVGGQCIVLGKTWIKFLKICKANKAAESFLEKLVANEIDNYLKYVYQVKSQREPDSYGNLPSHSIVRALGEFIKTNSCKVKDWNESQNKDLFITCLRILSLKYSKPLPPLDWCFLQELVHIPEMKSYCLDLASHQAILSGSARRLIENYIAAATEDATAEAIHVYRNLKYLANSIQPVLLKPFFQNSLHHALNANTDDILETFLRYLKEVLDDDILQDVNKRIIEEVLTELVFISDLSCKAFPLFLNCIASFSKKAQENITKFNLKQNSDEEFLKIVKISCHISKYGKSTTPLIWLNDIFEAAFVYNFGLNLYYEDIISVLKHNLNHDESPSWLNELFGEIQVKVADRCDENEIGFLCELLVIAVVHFSGLFTILPKNDYESIKYFFPAALTFLLDDLKWSNSTLQILEWLLHMNTTDTVPKTYRTIFAWALCSLRHQEEFSKSSRWMKYLDCELQIENYNT
ncbi:unnamed protein product [Ceutorhynchus assimilis]|uniref:DUF3730 domain-containing protein n=1 Tax=Ceutorhynchus assimilis TaxID=467358 RepID=A0A9N9MGL9_9CUCU|nr:unnamed protein product [Ceutorhynchus assimilis]